MSEKPLRSQLKRLEANIGMSEKQLLERLGELAGKVDELERWAKHVGDLLDRKLNAGGSCNPPVRLPTHPASFPSGK